METKLRERISIDLQGLKAPLMARSQVLGASPSDVMRRALAQALDAPAVPMKGNECRPSFKQAGDRRRLCLRMARDDAAAVLAAAQRAGLSPGAYVAGLMADVPVLSNEGGRSDHLAALTAANAQLASLSRNIHALTRFLTLGNVPQALVYRDMLDTLDGDVRRHLALAAGLLADLHPRGHITDTRHRSSR